MIKFTSKLVLILAVFLLPTGVWADNVSVNNWDALQNAINNATETRVITLTLSVTSNNSYLSIPSGKEITINQNGQTITRNVSSKAADGYVIKNEGKLTITGGGLIRGGNCSGNGGAIYNANTGDLTIENVEIGYYQGQYRGSQATYGAGIYNDGKLTIKGGTIHYNSATKGGAIYHNGSELNLEGAPEIVDNVGGGIYLASGKTITISGVLTNTTKIGISMETPATFTSGLSEKGTYNGNFASDESSLVELIADGDEAKLRTYWKKLQDYFTAGEDVTLSDNVEYKPHSSDTGGLVLASEKTMTLNLNGKTINRSLTSAIDNGYVIQNSGNLTITGTGTIRGGNNTGNGGGIQNTGTLSISSATISYNNATGDGGGIYNSGTLTIMGGTISNNTTSGNGGGICQNNVENNTFNLSGAPTIKSNTKSNAANNVYLSTDMHIDIAGTLSNTDKIGIINEGAHFIFTNGLSGNGNASYFQADNSDYGVGLNYSGEAIIGPKYTITRSYSNGYLYIKGANSNGTAVEDEIVPVSVNASANYIPTNLTYTAGGEDPVIISSYPKNNDNYSFTMPAANITLTATILRGGYCGVDEDLEKVKYVLDGSTLKFLTANNDDYATASYTPSNIPWRTFEYNSVYLTKNISSITPYAFRRTTLSTITVEAGSSYFQAIDNLLFSSDGKTLFCYPAAKEGSSYELPAAVTAVEDGAFAYCTHLATITVNAGNENYKAESGVLFNHAGTSLVCYPAQKADASYTISEDITAIRPYAFQGNGTLGVLYALRTVSVPTGGDAMFEGTSSTLKIMVKNNQGGNYKAADCWSDYQTRIFEMTLANAAVALSYTSVDYDGSAKEPGVTSVTSGAGDGLTLIQGTNFNVTYESNTNVGTATVRLTGINNYAGTETTKTFKITRQVVINVSGDYATYYAAEDLQKPHNFTVYVITGVNWTDRSLTTKAIDYIPREVPVILYRIHSYINNTYHLEAATSTPAVTYDDTHFKGVLTPTAFTTLKPDATVRGIYTLKGNYFYQATSGTLPANRCYILYLSEDPDYGASPSRLSLDDDGTTGINTVNGEELKIEDWKIYDLNGRLIKTPGKGIYIYNGKKIVIK